MDWLIAAIVVFVVWRFLSRRRRRVRAQHWDDKVTPYDGTEAWRAETGHFPPTEKQLDFIEELCDEIDYLGETLGKRVSVPRLPRNPDRAEASDHIARLLALRDRLEDL